MKKSNFVAFAVLVLCFALLSHVTASCNPTCVQGYCEAGVCQCDVSYVGRDCSIFDKKLQSGENSTNHHVSATMDWSYFHVNVPELPNAHTEWYVIWTIRLHAATYSSSSVYLFVRANNFPSTEEHDGLAYVGYRTGSVSIKNAPVGASVAGVHTLSRTALEYSISVELVAHSAGPNVSLLSEDDWSVQQSIVSDDVFYFQFQASSEWSSVHIEMASNCSTYWSASPQLPTSDRPGSAIAIGHTSQHNKAGYNISEILNGVYYVGARPQGRWCQCAARFTKSFPLPGQCPNQCSLHGCCAEGQVCQCNSAFAGELCEYMVVQLSFNSPVRGYVGRNAWNYYTVSDFTMNSLIIEVDEVNFIDGEYDCDLYVRRGAKPTLYHFDFIEDSSNKTHRVLINEPGDNVWHIGVFGYSASGCEYRIRAFESSTCMCGSDGQGSCEAGSSVCVCLPGWIGERCEHIIKALDPGMAFNGRVSWNNWQYFQVAANASYAAVVVRELNTTGLLWLFASATAEPPTLASYDALDRGPTETHMLTVSLDAEEAVLFTIGVYTSPFNQDRQDVSFEIVAWFP